MKPRRWIIIVVLLVLVAGIGLVGGLRFLEQNRTVERLLSKQLSPIIGGDLNISRARIGFFSLSLLDLTLKLPVRGTVVMVPRLTIGFSLWKLIAHKGNPALSVSSVSLNRPRLVFSVISSDTSATATSGSFPATLDIRNFPVSHVRIKAGLIAIVNPSGDTTVLGSELSGKLSENDNEINFDCKGKLASGRKNLSLSGAISRHGKKHRLSVRINKADISSALEFGSWTLQSGRLDGAVEILFSDTLSLSGLDIFGWISGQNLSCVVKGLSPVIKDLNGHISFSGPRSSIDSCSFALAGNQLRASGNCDLSGRSAWSIGLYGRMPAPKTLSSTLSSDIIEVNPDRSWIELNIYQDTTNRPVTASLSITDLSLFRLPIDSLEGRFTMRKGEIAIDSVRASGKNSNLFVSGLMSWTSRIMAYKFSVAGTADSMPLFPFVKGTFSAAGTVHGHAGRPPQISLSINAMELSAGSMDLGNIECIMRSSDNGLAISAAQEDNDLLQFSARIDGLFSDTGSFSGMARLGRESIEPILRGLPFFTSTPFDTLFLMATFGGTMRTWHGSAMLHLNTPQASGAFTVTVDGGASQGAFFKVFGNTLALNDSLFPLYGTGRLIGDTMTIDTLDAAGGLNARGKVIFGPVGLVDAEVRYQSIALTSLNRWVTGSTIPIEGGTISGRSRIGGTFKALATQNELHLSGADIAGMTGMQTDAVISTRGAEYMVRPFVVRQSGRIIAQVDTIATGQPIHGQYFDIDATPLISELVAEGDTVYAVLSGSFLSVGDSAFKVIIDPTGISYDRWRADSVAATILFGQRGMAISAARLLDGNRTEVTGAGFVPYTLLGEEASEADTATVSVALKGDLVASYHANLDPYVGGTGRGEGEFSLKITPESFVIKDASVLLTKGKLTVFPFVPDTIRNFSLSLSSRGGTRINTVASVLIGKKPMEIVSIHDLPEGFEPFKLGDLDFGVLSVKMPKGGTDIHLPGLMDIGKVGNFELRGKKPFKEFVICGPIEHPAISGTIITRNAEYTYPFLINDEFDSERFDPFPVINWDIDLIAGNRDVLYYYDINFDVRGRSRRISRFVEAYIDGASILSLRGCAQENSFRLLGSLRSYRGTLYWTTVYDRTFEVGVDFLPQLLPDNKGYDNVPVMWGSAETFADSSRFERKGITMMIKDHATGAVSEKGRIYEANDIVFKPSTGESFGLDPNKSTDTRGFYQETGRQFSTLAGTGEFVAGIGEQYFNRYLLNEPLRRLAKVVGLDQISLETSIASNYFTMLDNHTDSELLRRWDQLALSNLGITFGRYFLRDQIFLKWRTGLVPVDTLIHPEYSFGVEFQPLPFRNLIMDFNYGFQRENEMWQTNPSVNIQLRLPIKGNRN